MKRIVPRDDEARAEGLLPLVLLQKKSCLPYNITTMKMTDLLEKDKDKLLTELAAAGSADKAVRVAVWHNGERTVYAQPSADGVTPEPGCENFFSDQIAYVFYQDDFKVGYVDKFTVAVWLEGDDPECVDAIVGGAVEFTMKIAASNDIDTTLLQKYIQDIKDTLTGDKPINPAGTVSPDFQKYENVTWYTRRNQDGEDGTGIDIN